MSNYKYPCIFEDITQEEDSRFIKCKIKVQHDKLNLNKSYFEKDNMINCAEKSLRLTPILGSVIYDEEREEYRLNGHDMEYKIVQGEDGYEVKVHHIERIYGFVPQDAEITTEYNEEEDVTFLVTDGVLWKNYLDEVEDILNNKDGNTEVSMEISVQDYEDMEDGTPNITEYTFEGITMLGVAPAMKGANLQIFSSNVSDFKEELKELVKAYSLEKEGNVLDNSIQQVEPTVEPIEEPTVEPTIEFSEEIIEEPVVEESTTEPVVEEFSLSVDNIVGQIHGILSQRFVEREDYWGDMYQAREFYFVDILPDDKVAILENSDFSRREFFGVPYSMDGDCVSLDFESKKLYIHEWREMTGGEQVYSIEDDTLKNVVVEKFDGLVKEVTELKAQLDEMSDYAELKAFKEQCDKEQFELEINTITDMFSLSEEEVAELKVQVLAKEITKEQYQEKLAFKLFMKQLAEKQAEKVDEPEVTYEDKNVTISVPDSVTQNSHRYQGGAFDKFLNK